MTAVNAQEFYKTHQDQEKEFVLVSTAREVKGGETVAVDTILGIPAYVTAPEMGYEVSTCATDEHEFMTKAEFKAETKSVDGLELPAAKEDLTTEDLTHIKPVKKGQEIAVNPGIPLIAKAETDGFVVSDDENKYSMFVSNFELTSEFNYTGKKFETDKTLVVTQKSQPHLKGILLTEDVTFAFKAGDYEAKAGSVLYVNPDDEDGYTVTLASKMSPNAAFRVAPKAKSPAA